MADKHPSGNPKLVEQHKRIQRHGDDDLGETAVTRPERQPNKRRHAGDKRPEPTPNSKKSGFPSEGGSTSS